MSIRSKDLPQHVLAMMTRETKFQASHMPRTDHIADVGKKVGESVTITLPLPPKSLSPNARVHWAVKAKAVKAYRRIAACRTGIALGLLRPYWTHATTQVTFYHARKARRDPDNLLASLKPIFDGLVDAGLLADDEYLTHLPVVKLIDSDNPRVVLTITRQNPNAT